LLHELTGVALARGERLEALTVTRPTLEDVYLELTAGEDTDEPRAADVPLQSGGRRRRGGRRSRSRTG
jgi:ABC-2 type transport system ATP-binding protein